MKNQRTLIRFALAVCAVAGLALAAVAPVSTQAQPFQASIDISGDAVVCVGEPTTLNVEWSTTKDVTRSEWLVGSQSDGETSFEGTSAGADSREFSAEVPGLFGITFSLRHHTQTDRQGSETFWVTVDTCSNDDCPAAPAIANAYLDELNHEEARGDIIRAVAAAMTAGVFGTDKCDASYAATVRAFVDALMS